MERKYQDDSSSIEEMTKTEVATGIKLVEMGGNPHGEYLVLDENGNLKAGGNNGIFLEYKKLQ